MLTPDDLTETCPTCGKAITDEEYVVNWATCGECFGKHVAAYFVGTPPEQAA